MDLKSALLCMQREHFFTWMDISNNVSVMSIPGGNLISTQDPHGNSHPSVVFVPTPEISAKQIPEGDLMSKVAQILRDEAYVGASATPHSVAVALLRNFKILPL